jgi:hypothetical protein
VTGQEYTAGSLVSNEAKLAVESNFTPRKAELFELAALAENPLSTPGTSASDS